MEQQPTDRFYINEYKINGDQIEKLRAVLGGRLGRVLLKGEFAKLLNISQPAYSRMLRGEASRLTVGRVLKALRSYGLVVNLSDIAVPEQRLVLRHGADDADLETPYMRSRILARTSRRP